MGRPRFIRDTRGASLVEYLLLVGLVALAIIAGYRAFGGRVHDKADAQAACVASLSDCGTSQGSGDASLGMPSRSDVVNNATTPGASPGDDGGGFWNGVKTVAGWGWSFVKGFVWDGLAKGLIWGTLQFLGNQVYLIVTDPYQAYIGQWVDLGKGIATAVWNYDKTWDAITNYVSEEWEKDPARLIGRGVFEIAALIVPWTKIGKAKAVQEVATATKTISATEKIVEGERVVDTLSDAGKIAKAEQAAAKSVDELNELAKPFKNADEIPGGAGGVMTSNKSGKYLRTQDIKPTDLPYDSSLRPPRPVNLANSLDEMPQANVKKVTDTFFASDEHSGSAGVVRMAELEGGRPVAIKTYYPSRGAVSDADILSEARSAQLFDDLGIGPKYHGIYRDADGRLNVVTDIVPGDFSGTRVTQQTFQDLESMGTRLKGAGIEDIGDFQIYRTQDGRLMAIDPGGAADAIGHKAWSGADDVGGFMTRERMQQLGQADVDVGQAYLDQLKQTNPKAYDSIIQKMGDPNTKRWMGDKADEYLRRNP